MDEELTKSKKVRGGHRAYIRTVIGNVNELVADPEEASQKIDQLKQFRDILRDRLSTLADLNNAILNLLCSKEDVSEESIATETADAGKFEQEMRGAIMAIEEFCNPTTSLNIPSSTPPCATPSQGTSQQNLGKQKCVRLPKLEIRKFKGTLYEWQEFWDTYEGSIHNNNSLAEVEKFAYLRSLLEGPARNAIMGFSLTAANYNEAVDLLKKRYGKKQEIQRSHINELLNISAIYNDKDTVRLRTFYDSVETHHRALRALGVDEITYSTIVVPSIMEKLPIPIRLTISRDSDFLDWSMTDLLKNLLKEVELRERHQLKSRPCDVTRGTGPRRAESFATSTASSFLTGNEDIKCAFCLGSHPHVKCTRVTDFKERKNIARKFSRCFKCLRKGHRIVECKTNITCSKCKGDHHEALCSNLDGCVTQGAEKPSSLHVSTGSRVALQTAQAQISGEGKNRVIRVLFDSGSHRSFVTANVVKDISIRVVRKEWLGISTFGNQSKQIGLKDVVELTLGPVGGGEPIPIEAYVVPEIASIANEHLELVKNDFPHLSGLWLSDVCKHQHDLEIDVLIGSDYLWRFQGGRTIRGGPDEPVALKTSLGWVLSGPLKGRRVNEFDRTAQVSLIVEDSLNIDRVEKEFHKLWDLDSIGIREVDSVQEEFLDSVTFNDSRYSVRLPWKAGRDNLPTNYANSMSRLRSVGNRLKRQPDILDEYDQVIREQLKCGVIERVSDLETGGRVHYLPHHAVVRKDAATTKVRIVYDASSREKKSDFSLNDCLHVGPSLNPLLFDILLRFRVRRIVLIGDIEKAFLNIEIDESDRDCLRFLWFDDPRNRDSKVEVFRFCRVVFGLNASPFLLNGTIRHHLSQWEDKDPEFVRQMTEGFYVDDLVTGEDSVESAFSVYSKAKHVMGQGGFKLRKWVTNDEGLRESIKVSERGLVGDVEEDKADDESYAKSSLGAQDDHHQKVLGLPWNCTEDILCLSFKEICDKAEELKFTKRKLLSLLAGLFDPLGIMSPVTVCMKILMQDLCKQGVNWDEELTGSFRKRWDVWISSLRRAGDISVDRHIFGGFVVKECFLHGFADASKTAFCAVVYAVFNVDGCWKVSLLTSKSRVAPLKDLTIPRLELVSARVLAQLVETVKSALASQLSISGTYLWSDSLTVLYWLQNRGEWKQFVKHRVQEILKLTRVEDWRHCPGKVNPADLGSRGMQGDELKDSSLWWHGPQWLSGDESGWPGFSIERTQESEEEERRSAVMMVGVEEVKSIAEVINIEHYSDLSRLFRVSAWVLRFVNNLVAKTRGGVRNNGVLKRREIFQAEEEWIKVAQSELKGQPNFNQLVKRFDLIDCDGVLRCQGRLCHSDLDYEAIRPVILPKNHRLTELIVRECHSKVHHSGVRDTLAEVRSRFWIPKGRQLVKKILNKCVVCRRWEGKACSAPAPASLPAFRVRQAEPFSRTGVDFAGPLLVKAGNGKFRKEYVSLFTCCVTRAVHLDLVQGMQAPVFRRCLRRFTARRGLPDLMVSDNAKTFKATERALKELFDHPEIQAELEKKRIEWRFNLERAPWWGGFFERMVGCMKRCIRKTLGSAKLTHDELLTVLTEVEATLNSRPLTYSYQEAGEEVLTPSHLLYGRRLISMPDDIVEPPDARAVDHNARFRYLSTRLQHFWKRWRREYLTDLREYHKGKITGEERLVDTGDVVVVYDEGHKRGKWKTGVVEDLVVGTDGVVRGARVRVIVRGKPKHLNRPVQLLYPIEVKSEPEGPVEPNLVEPPAVVQRPKRKSALKARQRIGEIFHLEDEDNNE